MCDAVCHDVCDPPMPFWTFVVALLLVGILLGELARRLVAPFLRVPVAPSRHIQTEHHTESRAPVVASCPWSALGCACDEIYKHTQEEPEATPQRVQEELAESSAPTSARPLVLSMLHVSDQGVRWHTRSDCFGLQKATRARALTPCQICARNF